MVRRQGKRKMQALLGSGNDEKKKEGESSFSRVDAQGARDPKCRREEEQQLRAHTPGLSFSYLPFKFGCVELNLSFSYYPSIDFVHSLTMRLYLYF
jgi:hypothetical protein